MRAYIVGSQRSGTTLMRMILEGHPDVETWGDTDSLNALDTGKFPEGEKKCQIFKVPYLTDWLYLRKAYTGQPLIFMVRDPRDVIASLARLDNTAQWLVPAYTHQTTNPEWSGKYSREIGLAKSSVIGKAALYVRSKMESYFMYIERGVEVAPVIYEELVAAPEDSVRRVLKLLDLRFYKKILDVTNLDYSNVRIGEGTFYDTFSPERSIDTASVGRYERELSEGEIALIEDICGDVYDRIVGSKNDRQP